MKQKINIDLIKSCPKEYNPGEWIYETVLRNMTGLTEFFVSDVSNTYDNYPFTLILSNKKKENTIINSILLIYIVVIVVFSNLLIWFF